MAANSNSEARKSDLDKTGRVNTKVETQTQVVDNTEAAAARAPVEYDVEVGERPNGTIIHTYMEPKGGFPQDNEDA